MEKWYQENGTTSTKKEISEFLLENSETEFSEEDVNFYLARLYSTVFMDFASSPSTLELFLTNEKRILSTIQFCEKNQRNAPLIISGIGCIIIRGNMKLDNQKFLLENFPISLLENDGAKKTGYTNAFYVMCLLFRGREVNNDMLKKCTFCNKMWIIFDKTKLMSPSPYFESLLILSKTDHFLIFVSGIKEKSKQMLEKIILKKDVFLKIREVRRIISGVYSPSQRNIVIVVPPQIKEIYTHFVLKRIIFKKIFT